MSKRTRSITEFLSQLSRSDMRTNGPYMIIREDGSGGFYLDKNHVEAWLSFSSLKDLRNILTENCPDEGIQV